MSAHPVLRAAFLGLFLLWPAARGAMAAELKVLCANGMQPVVESLRSEFERASGHRLLLVFATGGETIRAARESDAGGVVIGLHEGVQQLVQVGSAVPGSAADLGSTGISIAVREGAPRPDISTAQALKRTLLLARSITYLNPADGGASGIHFAKVLERLGIADDVKARTVFASKAAAVGELVASGTAELGILQYQLLYAAPGVEIVGPLPGDLQSSTVFSAAVLRGAGDPAAAASFLAFLQTQAAGQAMTAKGIEPMPR
jgi:molybdate transport system substrate-binding protein